jgi:hypothetical protein
MGLSVPSQAALAPGDQAMKHHFAIALENA